VLVVLLAVELPDTVVVLVTLIVTVGVEVTLGLVEWVPDTVAEVVLVDEIVLVAVKDVLDEIDMVPEVDAVDVGSDDVVTTLVADEDTETENEDESQPEPERVTVTELVVELETDADTVGVLVTHAVLDGDKELERVPDTVDETVDDCEGLDPEGTDDEDTVLVPEIEGEPEVEPQVDGDAD